MGFTFRKRSLTRIVGIVGAIFAVKTLFFTSRSNEPPQIKQHGVLDLVSLGGNVLDAQRHDFLQVRMGRDERPDILDAYIYNGFRDYWERFQKP